MNTVTADTLAFRHNFLYALVNHASSEIDVVAEVIANHDNNRWWPNNVQDWRLRMLFAGWTTRVSYRSIESYQAVVKDATKLGFDGVAALDDADLRSLVGPLGMFQARRTYLHSLAEFVRRTLVSFDALERIPNDKLISAFAQGVQGASYKVAQCAVLYAKGYHCGVIPVDSGMCEMLVPLLGTPSLRYPENHEAIRRTIEEVVISYSSVYERIMSRACGDAATKPEGSPPTWFVHLLLIYYKRLRWNAGKSAVFPRKEKSIVGPAAPSPNALRYPLVVVEGADGVGKTTLAERLANFGYARIHSKFRENHSDIVGFYVDQINSAPQPAVLDRSFFSELAYGPVHRDASRIGQEEARLLTRLLRKRGGVVLHLEEPVATLVKRGIHTIDPMSTDEGMARAVICNYRQMYSELRNIVPVHYMQPSCTTPGWSLAALATAPES